MNNAQVNQPQICRSRQDVATAAYSPTRQSFTRPRRPAALASVVSLGKRGQNEHRRARRNSRSSSRTSRTNPTPNLRNKKQTLALVIFVVVLVVLIPSGQKLAAAQCPDKTMTSFERIGGVTIKEGLTVLYQANASQATIGHHHHHSSMHGASNNGPNGTTTTLYQISTPITAECNNRCRRSKSCRAFLVDYSQHTCWSVEHPPAGQHLHSQTPPVSSFNLLDRAPTPIHLVPTNQRTAYFEKVCLNLPLVECERAWIFERVLSHQIHGHDDKIIEDVPSRLKCQEHCLNERQFKCRSGEYDYLNMQCRLSMVDRHMKQQLFRPTPNANIDYFENQCVSAGNQCDAFDRYEDMDLGRAEIMRTANSSEQCQQYCTQTIKAFICRSFTWSPLTGRCYLNSANTLMVGGMDKLLQAPGLVYYQRNECIDLKLECDTTSMTLNLRTNEPFRGRMYVRDDPQACETLGRSALMSSLSIPFQSPMGRCAQRELPSRYSSVVVVQQHPMIQRKSDRYIKLVCDFQTANKTITSHYNVMANPWTSTALINATSFAPKILLRITDKFGHDITGAKLGDELQLRIEAETDSVYDMVARSVLAKSGTTDESIVLIDRDGCPADFRIFPPLRKLNKRTIIGRFDAFKFSSDVVVRFQVDVQFCLNSCPPTSCPLQDQNQNLFNVNSQQLETSLNGGGGGTSVSAAASSGGSDQQQQLLGSTTSSPSNVQASSGADDSSQLAGNSLEYQRSSSTTYRPAFMASVQQQGQGNTDYMTTNSLLLDQQQQQYNNKLEGANSLLSTRRAAQPPANLPPGSSSTANPPQSSSSINPNYQPASPNVATSSDQLFDSQARDSGRVLHLIGEHPIFRPPSPLHYQKKKQHQQPTNNYDGAPSNLMHNQMDSVETLQQQDQQQNSHRRRRRSAEPIPVAPKHVPLQREIIIFESSSALSGGRDQQQVNKSKAQQSESTLTTAARGQRDMKSRSNTMTSTSRQQHNKPSDQGRFMFPITEE